MGWDAYANTRFRRDFKEAAALVKLKTDCVDAYLHDAGLDCSACGYFLQEAVSGQRYLPINEWDKETVQNNYKKAKWPKVKDIHKDERWAMESAKEFLRVCAKLNCSITFSY